MRRQITNKYGENKSNQVNAKKSLTKPVASVEFKLPKELVLFDLPLGGKPIENQWATAEQLKPFTGLDDAALRRLERAENPETKKPWVPAAKLNKRPVAETLIGVREWREQKLKSTDQRIDHYSFPSMEACEGATGITKTLQHLAKSKGCAAFRGPRVYLMELVRWIFKEAAAGGASDWGKMNTELDAKLKQVKLDTELRSLITRTEVEEFVKELTAILFGGIKRLEMECPREFEMRPKDYIKTAIEGKRREIFRQAETQFEKLKTTEPELATNAT